MKILTLPNKLLRRVARPLDKITPLRRKKVKRMLKLMHNSRGIGLAAPQVGWNVQLFVMNVTQDPSNDLVFINPEVVEEGGGTWIMDEGCLSIPGVSAPVERNLKVTVKARGLDWEEFELTDNDMAGRCMLHEIDHLSGVLFTDKIKAPNES